MKCNPHTFSEFFVGNRQKYVRYAFSYLRDERAAEDVVADSFLSFWKIHETLPDDTQMESYIFRSVRNRCIDCLRKQRRSRIMEGGLSNLEDWDISTRLQELQNEDSMIYFNDIRDIVSSVLKQMPEKTEKAFRLTRDTTLKRSEIASMLGISEKGVEFHITKILKALRLALKDYL